MGKGIYRTTVLATVACVVLVYCAMTVFGATADAMLHYLLCSVLLVMLAMCAAALVFVLMRVFRGSR